MKKLLTILILFAAIRSNAQIIKIKSKSILADSIWINRGAIEVAPLPTGNGSDTIRSIDYKIYPSRDTLQTMTIQVSSYNKNAGLIMTDYVQASESLYGRWKPIITAIDTYIQAQRKRISKL